MRLLAIVALLVFCVCELQRVAAQDKSRPIKKCRVQTKNDGEYKLISISRTIREPIVTGLRIVVKDSDFNTADMKTIAAKIKAEYCEEAVISAAIFDDKRVAKQARSVIDYLTGTRMVPELRGFYSLDRTTGAELLSFSRKRGRPADEIKVHLCETLDSVFTVAARAAPPTATRHSRRPTTTG